MGAALKAAVAVVLALGSAAALAGPAYVDIERRLDAAQLHATGLDGLSPEQLALLNRLLRDDVARAVEEGTAEAQARREASSALVGLSDEPVHSRIPGQVAGWGPGTVFVLENGQRWKVLKGEMKLRAPFESPEVSVIPGIAGRWFLQLDEDLPKARVYRLD